MCLLSFRIFFDLDLLQEHLHVARESACAHKCVQECKCACACVSVGLVYVCCWPQGARLRPNYLSGVDITYPPANLTQRTTGPCSKAPVDCQLNCPPPLLSLSLSVLKVRTVSDRKRYPMSPSGASYYCSLLTQYCTHMPTHTHHTGRLDTYKCGGLSYTHT